MKRLALLLLFAVPCFAQEKPLAVFYVDHYTPRSPVKYHAGREFWTEVAAVGAAWTADTITTHQLYSRCATCDEKGYLFTGSRSTAKIMASWAAVDAGVVLGAYEWKKHVNNRWLNPLWRVALGQRIYAHTDAAFSNPRVGLGY